MLNQHCIKLATSHKYITLESFNKHLKLIVVIVSINESLDYHLKYL